MRGREEIGAAAVVITLVDVVVFFPIAFIQGQVGRQIAEFAIVVVISTLTSLFVSFTITPTLAGLWALRSHWKPWRVVDWFGQRFDGLRDWYTHRALPWGLEHGRLVALFCAGTFVAGARAGRARRRRRRVHSAGRPRRDLHPAHLSDRHAAPDGRKRHVRARAKMLEHARHRSRTPRSPARTRRRSAASSRRATSARSTSGSKTTASIRPTTGCRSSGEIAAANSAAGVQAVVVPATSTPAATRSRSTSSSPTSPAATRRRTRRKSISCLQKVPGADERQQHRHAARAGDLDRVRPQQGAGARRGSRPGGAGRRRRVRRQRGDAVRDDGGPRASPGDLPRVVPDEPRRAEVGRGPLVDRRHRLPQRHRALRIDADGAADHAHRPQQRHPRRRELRRGLVALGRGEAACSSACRRCTCRRTSSCGPRRSGSKTSCTRRWSAWASR